MKKIENINLLDIFNAVESLDNNKLFSFHENPNKKCPVGSKINDILQPKLDNVQNAMEKELQKTSLKDIYKLFCNNVNK